MFRLPVRAIALAVLLSPILAADRASDQSVDQANRVEEDWVLVVDGTASSDGPQLNTVMGPTADLSQPAVSLGINYRQGPVFAAGGLQVLVFNQYGLAASQTLAPGALNPNETVTWTQRMSLSGGQILYAIPTLNSTAWGTLGSDGTMASFTTSVNSLRSYDPDASAANSGAAWKTKGLTSLTLVQVRYYAGNSLLLTDASPRSVDCTKSFSKP